MEDTLPCTFLRPQTRPIPSPTPEKIVQRVINSQSVKTNALKTRPVSSTFPPRDAPEMRDSSIEETSDAAAEQKVE